MDICRVDILNEGNFSIKIVRIYMPTHDVGPHL